MSAQGKDVGGVTEQTLCNDVVERLANKAGWDNRKYMTPADYRIWCDRMRLFVNLVNSLEMPARAAAEAPRAEHHPEETEPTWDELHSLFDEVYEREWEHAAELHPKARLGMADKHATLAALQEVVGRVVIAERSRAKPTEAAPVEPIGYVHAEDAQWVPKGSYRECEMRSWRDHETDVPVFAHPPTDSAARQAYREITERDAELALKAYVQKLGNCSVMHMLSAMQSIGCVIKETP